MYVFPHLPIADIATLRIYAGIILQKERQANTGAVRDALAGITDYYGMGDGAIPAGNPQTQQLGRTNEVATSGVNVWICLSELEAATTNAVAGITWLNGDAAGIHEHANLEEPWGRSGAMRQKRRSEWKRTSVLSSDGVLGLQAEFFVCTPQVFILEVDTNAVSNVKLAGLPLVWWPPIVFGAPEVGKHRHGRTVRISS
ncbi:hypothetical protein NLI96_g4682 [Meripilus lineatus]|uniref:Uncharacterized protein n=1 Tax=Meripilus lineatus TaxID=2056292 RepID=A0AAD5V430_9APHY|nr:hypothetical protein NLI96_g4682 [Physisporinus lineatus]